MKDYFEMSKGVFEVWLLEGDSPEDARQIAFSDYGECILGKDFNPNDIEECRRISEFCSDYGLDNPFGE